VGDHSDRQVEGRLLRQAEGTCASATRAAAPARTNGVVLPLGDDTFDAGDEFMYDAFTGTLGAGASRSVHLRNPFFGEIPLARTGGG